MLVYVHASNRFIYYRRAWYRATASATAAGEKMTFDLSNMQIRYDAVKVANPRDWLGHVV